MRTAFIEASDFGRWDAFVDGHARGAVYHLSCWKDVLERSFGHIRGRIIAVWDGDQVVAGLPVYLVKSLVTGRRLVSAPFALVCDPLITHTTDMDAILEALMDLYRSSRCAYFELRAAAPQPLLPRAGFGCSKLYRTHNLHLDRPPEQLAASFHKNAARSLRRALKSGIELKHGRDKDDLAVFYRMLMDSRKRMGLPTIPRRYFEALWDVFRPRGQLDLLLAVVDGVPAAGKLLLKQGDTVFFEYGCDVLQYRRLRVNHFLEWKAIEQSREEGYRNYNFGRTSIHNRGLLQYKRRWGTDESELLKFYFPASYGARDEMLESSRKYGIARKIFQNAPKGLSQVLGGLFYRFMG